MPCSSCPAQTDERPSMLEDRHSGPDPELRSSPALGAPPCDRGPANEARLLLRISSLQIFYSRTRFLQDGTGAHKRTSRGSETLFPNPHNYRIPTSTLHSESPI